jgi:hypothetical protein
MGAQPSVYKDYKPTKIERIHEKGINKDKKLFLLHIEKIIKDIDSYGYNKGGYISFPEDSKQSVLIDDYVWDMYQSITHISKNDKEGNYISLIQLIYGLTHSNMSHCTGNITIMEKKGLIILKTKTSEASMGTKEKPSKEFIEFGKEFIKRINETDCPFTTLHISIFLSNGQGHSNILIVFKKEGKIYLSIYEPHGSDVDSSPYLKLSNYLMYKLYDLYPDLIVVSDRTSVSCPRGLQAYAKDEKGWCVIFSLFWLYCVLYISSKTNNGINLNNIYLIEHAIIYLAKKPEILYIMTVKFSMYLSSSYLEYIEGLSPKLKENFNNMFKTRLHKRISEDWFNTTQYSDKSDMSESDKIERQKYLDNVSNTGHSQHSKRKPDGAQCSINANCLSDICKDNKCLPYSSAYKPHKNYKRKIN